MRLVLGSGSATRRQMLLDAGLRFEVERPDVDEDAVKNDWTGNPTELAAELARRKALAVSSRCPDALVIGADQVLDLDGRVFSKPSDRAAARAHLAALSGRTHKLRTSMALAVNNAIVFQHNSAPALTLFPLSDQELDAWIAEMPDSALQTVGAYQVEGPAIRLFQQIDGPWHDILGLPLLVLQSWLRENDQWPY